MFGVNLRKTKYFAVRKFSANFHGNFLQVLNLIFT